MVLERYLRGEPEWVFARILFRLKIADGKGVRSFVIISLSEKS